MHYPLLSDEYFMNEALKEARMARESEEVPVGAVIVHRDRIIARAYNMTRQLNDVTAHAEMIAITAASNYLGSKYLSECSLFVTLEPCLMCATAMKWAQVGRIVYGASDPREGYSRIEADILHKKSEVTREVLDRESAELLRQFFLDRR